MKARTIAFENISTNTSRESLTAQRMFFPAGRTAEHSQLKSFVEGQDLPKQTVGFGGAISERMRVQTAPSLASARKELRLLEKNTPIGIVCACCLPESQLICVGSTDSKITFYDSANGDLRPMGQLKGLSSIPRSCCGVHSKDTKCHRELLIIGSDNGSIDVIAVTHQLASQQLDISSIRGQEILDELLGGTIQNEQGRIDQLRKDLQSTAVQLQQKQQPKELGPTRWIISQSDIEQKALAEERRKRKILDKVMIGQKPNESTQQLLYGGLLTI
ncbi:MAG: hypothetical protein EZS28_015059 [Streblomastix strix]|uniref:Uncharacterized protein n=1 Tax=Streblomastix strix TaxID=222440 RepID=A0A5J4W346_9EUKA|nr:MAG: hypothetical protein EZS28_015059 [Streblomastix strix]